MYLFSLHYGSFFMLLLLSDDLFFFKKNLLGILSAVSNSLDPDQDRQNVGPDLGQTVCKGYQQMLLLLPANFFFKIIFFKNFCQEHYQSVKQFGSRSGSTECQGVGRSKYHYKRAI